MTETLNEVEIRILGSLIEKELTTPQYYPLSLNALKQACNQKSNRDPVVEYDENTVMEGVRSLQRKGLIIGASGAGQRVRKYLHKFKEKYFVNQKEMAILCELMLRGPQTPGELRNRASRMHPFPDLSEVYEVLKDLMEERENPLVIEIPRQPGQKESRYMHLLAGEPEIIFEDSGIKNHINPNLTERLNSLESEIHLLREELRQLKENFENFRRQFE